MPSNILVDITSVAASGNATGTWSDINALSASGITVQGTNSVLLLIFSLQLNDDVDHTAEFRFTVNGSPTNSPNITQFVDNPFEGCGVCMAWAVDGLSGGSNSFAVQWRTIVGTNSANTNYVRMLQVIEIVGGDAEILVDQTATSNEQDPATWADLFTASGITVAGTDSILLMIANVPYEMEGDERTEFQFAVDSTREGANTMCYTDSTDEGDGWSGVHVTTGLSAGTHSFHLQWQEDSGNGQTDVSGRTRTFQVVEITANAALKLNLSSATVDSPGATYTDVDNLTSSYTVVNSAAIALMFANVQINGASDENADFSFGIDGTEEGGSIISFTDDAVLTQRMLLGYARNNLSNASHTFSLRWRETVVAPSTGTSQTRTMFVIEFTNPTYKLEGVTKDKEGVAKATCECFLCKDNLDNTCSFISHDQSDGAGIYNFTGLIDDDSTYFVISWKDDTPHIFDMTDHVLQPVVE